MAVRKSKRGVFFTIDSIFAAGIILIAFILASSSYLKEVPTVHLNYFSHDLITTLSSLTVEEVDNAYVNARIGDGSIKNRDNSILEQVAEFWSDNEMEFANKTVSNVTDPLIPKTMGYGVWVNNETIYKRDMPIKKALVSSKKIISGVTIGDSVSRAAPPTLAGPFIVEIRVWQ